jgi:phosphatidylglycerophosphatase A
VTSPNERKARHPCLPPAGAERARPAPPQGLPRTGSGGERWRWAAPENRHHHRRRLGLPFWHPAVMLATWFGAGFLPVTPGSWGSLAALPFAWAIRTLWGPPGLALAAAIVFILGWWAAAAVVAASGLADPGAIVIDEVAAQWLVLMAAPLDPLAWALAFVLFRIFDIGKPWPVGWADRHIHGGLGVMLDDLLAAGYAALVLAALTAIGGVPGVRS